MGLNDKELASHQAKGVIVDEEPGYPCRVSLEDAKIGERVLLTGITMLNPHIELWGPYL